jgi:hypothetical protein
MQVFGLNIGNYLPGEPEPRLSDLEVELSQEIQQEMSYKFIVTHSLIARTRLSHALAFPDCKAFSETEGSTARADD